MQDGERQNNPKQSNCKQSNSKQSNLEKSNHMHYMKMNIIIAVGTVLMLVGTFIWSILQYQHTDFAYYNNEIRVQLNAEREQIVSGNYIDSDYDYLVCDLSGKVLYMDGEWQQHTGDSVVVEELLQKDHSFVKEYNGYEKNSFILQDSDGKCCGFLVYLLPESMYTGEIYTTDMVRCFFPVGFGVLLTCIVLIARALYINRRIIRPLQQISTSAKAIIAGNYDIEVHRVYGEKLEENEVGELTYSYEMMRDELKAKQISEQALRKSQQELISCISHDLRTPISTIKAYSEGIRDGVLMEGMEQKDYLNIILDKTNLLEKMIADLLEYSNTQLNKMDIVKKEIYFRDYMLEIARELRILVTRSKVTFTSNIMDENILVNMDEKRITEVLYNLVENSLKYIDKDDGRIELIAEVVQGTACIHIRDNGMGISAADIPYVFDKFYRAEKSRSSNIPGSGLGLSICKYIVNQHGGNIYCHSSKSEGSDFWFTLEE